MNNKENPTLKNREGEDTELPPSINMDTFCVAPFTHQSTKTDGSVKACCRAKGRVSTLTETNLVDAWNWQKLRQLRLDLCNGIQNDMCKVCWDHEANDVESMRVNINKNVARKNLALERANRALKNNGNLEGDDKPIWFEFKLNNNCNLKCRMCSPVDSSAWFKDHKLIKHIPSNFGETYQEYVQELGLENKALLNLYNKDNFWNTVEDWTSIGKEFQFAGGEPLYDADHYKVLEMLKQSGKDLSQIELTYATNLTVLETKKYSVFDYWKDYKQINLGFSIDGPPGINEYIRGGSNIEDIKNNILEIRNKLDNVNLKAKITVQALNIYYIPDLIDWLYKINVTNIGSSYVMSPDHLDARVWCCQAREDISQKYRNAIERLLPTQISAKRNLTSILNYFHSRHMHTEERWHRFIEWNTILDKSRNESYKNYEFFNKYIT